ncbi:hypothetical protein ABZ454_09330 [Streptomyces sp. NPDC005803]|uniref:hypothetical protein n=1 Tax=Streptomyces sp. NPDC005803 TaxID=3154297 RepID=UPI0033E6DA37
MSPPPRHRTLDLLVMADPGWPTEVAERLKEDLAGLLGEASPDVDWRVTVVSSSLGVLAQTDLPRMMYALNERLQGRTWDIAVFVTDLPYRDKARPVVLMLSPSEQIALLSLPSLGMFRISRRVRDAVLGVIGELFPAKLGETLLPRRIQYAGQRRYYVLPGTWGRVRLLAGMVRANRPWLLFLGLSRALAGVFATTAFGLISNDVWQVSRHLDAAHDAVLTLASITAVVAWLVIDHELWERPSGEMARHQARLYNVATIMTLYVGIVCLYAVLFLLVTVTAVFLLTPETVRATVGQEPSAGYYLSLAWFITSMGTVGGALGVGLEDDRAVRQAAYGTRQRQGQRQDTDWPGAD